MSNMIFDGEKLSAVEAENIYNNTIAKIELDRVYDMDIKFAITKLKYGGEIHIAGHELTEILRCGMTRELSLKSVQDKINSGFISSLFLIVPQLEAAGLKIINKRINNYQYYIKAVRPEPAEK